jgi:choline dehydrogenase-like flavoprotein
VTHLSFRDDDVELVVDYVVVGSGAGGATAANALARGGAKVALVEAGPWRDPDDYPSSTYGAMRDLFDQWGVGIAKGRALWPIVQASCVGGTTVINCAICVRTPEDVMLAWERDLGVGSAAWRQGIWRHQEKLEVELCAEVVPRATAGRSNLLAAAGAAAVPYDGHPMTRYVKGCAGSGQCLQGCKQLRKQSLNLQFVPEVIALGGTVLSCAPVGRILFEGRRAVGVRGDFREPVTRRRGGRFTVRARKGVVVAASVTRTAPLLAASGVRHPLLGRGFRAHPGTGVIGVYDEDVDMNVGATQGWASVQYRVEPGMKIETLSIPPEMVASRLAGAGAELVARMGEYRKMAMWVVAVRAESVGRVRRGFFGEVSVDYGFVRADMERLRTGLALLARTHFAAGARRVIPGIFGLPYDIGPDEVGLIADGPLDPRAYVVISSHLFGGTVMDADPARGVCDDHGRVHGYENLAVADASVIPSTLGVNPQHTIMALARTFAERLLDA